MTAEGLEVLRFIEENAERWIDRAELFHRLNGVQTVPEAYAIIQDMPGVFEDEEAERSDRL